MAVCINYVVSLEADILKNTITTHDENNRQLENTVTPTNVANYPALFLCECCFASLLRIRRIANSLYCI